jgi:hypothetical protein
MTEPTPDHRALASRDAGLGVGHIWTELRCPAYASLDPNDDSSGLDYCREVALDLVDELAPEAGTGVAS